MVTVPDSGCEVVPPPPPPLLPPPQLRLAKSTTARVALHSINWHRRGRAGAQHSCFPAGEMKNMAISIRPMRAAAIHHPPQ